MTAEITIDQGDDLIIDPGDATIIIDAPVVIQEDGSAGDVVGPVGATPESVALFDGATGKLLKELGPFQTLTPTGTTQTIDLSAGRQWIIDLVSATGDVTIALNNPLNGAVYSIKVIQGATDRDLVWPASVKWQGGTAPVITSGNDAIDVVQLMYDGALFLGLFSQAFA
jgi:hypothetical protein